MSLSLTSFLEVMPPLLKAAVVTVEISILSLAFACVIAPPLAIARMIGPWPLRFAVSVLVEAVRGVPPLVVIAFVYFALPAIGLTFSGFWTGVTALALGFPVWRAYLEILFPQALKRILPPLTNELANVIKASALLSVISVNEISHVGQGLIFETFIVVEILIQMAVLYLIIVGCLSALSRALERRLAH